MPKVRNKYSIPRHECKKEGVKGMELRMLPQRWIIISQLEIPGDDINLIMFYPSERRRFHIRYQLTQNLDKHPCLIFIHF